MIQHQIRLTDDTPIRCKPYPLPYAMREELRNEVDTMLEMGVMRPSTLPFTSPIVMVKKDGSNRVCVDFRKLNKITKVDPEPMTTAEDLFRRLSGKKYLSKIDLTKGYWQIPVAPEDVHKTAFRTPDGQYEFTRMSFGMVNSGATLVRGLRKILEGMPVSTFDRPPKERKGRTYPVERGTGACILPFEGIPVAGASPEASRSSLTQSLRRNA